jgi:hypothetical protein
MKSLLAAGQVGASGSAWRCTEGTASSAATILSCRSKKTASAGAAVSWFVATAKDHSHTNDLAAWFFRAIGPSRFGYAR